MNQPTHQHARVAVVARAKLADAINQRRHFCTGEISSAWRLVERADTACSAERRTAIVLVIQFWLYPALLWKLQEE
jgi:hypothetical protein